MDCALAVVILVWNASKESPVVGGAAILELLYNGPGEEICCKYLR